MALLWRVLKVQSGVTQWVTACSQLTPLLLSQRQWLQTSSGIFQWSQKRLSQVDGGSEQVTGVCPWPNRTYHTTVQLLKSKDSSKPIEEKVGALTKIIEAMGFTGPLKYSRWKIKIAALRMYTSCVEKTDFEEFFLRCQMPDTFNSWFLITLLHVWMCLVRMKQEGRSGNYMCRIIVHFMWEDVEQRGRVMGGILSDDHGLAAAIWRTFFNQKCEDPRQLELLVEYVRKQMQYLDSMNGEELLLTGEVTWRPLVEKNPQSVLKPNFPTYNDEGL
uniref:Ubiquinol-cytochrome c reductase complex assembly factor 1 n=1 Tax=Sarcophilus harrisii TaxID=9305 RepID=G3X200_SARHA